MSEISANRNSARFAEVSEKLGGRVDSMTFDQGETHVDYSGAEKSDAKMKPNSG
jgi:hypothetical protein